MTADGCRFLSTERKTIWVDGGDDSSVSEYTKPLTCTCLSGWMVPVTYVSIKRLKTTVF